MTTALARRPTAPGRHVYDCIVVGGQLAGAMTAALCAKRGLHVLYVMHDGLAAPYLHQDVLLPHLAFVMPQPRAVAAFEELLTETGLATQVQRAVTQPSLQLLRNAIWFELKRDEKERAAELKRALRTTAEAFVQELERAVASATPSDAFFATRPDLLPEGLFARWRFKRMVAKVDGVDGGTTLPKESLFRAFMPWAAGVDGPSPLTEARPLGRLLASVCTAPGGREGLCAQFIERARELGADIVESEPVEQITFDGGSAAGVRLERGETTYRAPFIVGATDLDVLQRLVPEQRRGAAKVMPTAKRAVFTLNLVVPEAGLPRGLGELALLESPAGPVLIQVAKTRGPGIDSATTELRTLTASTVAPVALKAGQRAAVKAFIDELWGRLNVFLPFTRPHVKLESTPWLDARGVVDHGAEPLPLLEPLPGSWQGLTGLTTASCWKRLLLANRQVLPGLGLEGEVIAAQRVADRIEKIVKKNDPLKKRSA